MSGTLGALRYHVRTRRRGTTAVAVTGSAVFFMLPHLGANTWKGQTGAWIPSTSTWAW